MTMLSYSQCEILLALRAEPGLTQRELAEKLGQSLGFVNRGMKALRDGCLLDGDGRLTGEALSLLDARRPRRAVILAAGYGMRMVPVSNTPKALLEVRGERLIERQIRQLRSAGVHEITVVAGYRKEQFEYLTDAFGVRLLINPDYASSNNLHSLALAACGAVGGASAQNPAGEESGHSPVSAEGSRAYSGSCLENCYIVPCDLWCEENPFRPYELCSWYAVSAEEDASSDVRVNRKGELLRRSGRSETGSRMVGIAYFCGADAACLRERLQELDALPLCRGAFWEEALYEDGRAAGHTGRVGDRMFVPARVLPAGDALEINTYEQLRELDAGSGSLQAAAMAAIRGVFGVGDREITDIAVLKKGMTNRSFLFTVRGETYIMRIPGEGTEKLISRRQEATVYAAIRGQGLCDDPVYLNPETGYKITRYLPDARVCDPADEADLRLCMRKLRAFHELRLQVPHSFDVWGQIDFYESLWPSPQSLYRDYDATKAAVLSLKPFVNALPKVFCLTHIDAVCDNFLFFSVIANRSADIHPAHIDTDCDSSPSSPVIANRSADRCGNPSLPQLTDWEYAGMADPHLDLAMFAVYSAFDRSQLDHLIDLYFEGACPPETRIKIHCYAAACGLLWSNWCEYKSSLGVEFGEYSLQQYRAAKTFARLAAQEIADLERGPKT